jgi:hypothetical protein
MLNLDETLFTSSRYGIQRNFYLRVLFYSIGTFSVLELLRGQITEINLVQLIPGFYLILAFFSFLLLISLSDAFFRIPSELDTKKECGTKTTTRLELTVLIKFGVFILLVLLYLIVNNIFPLSLDSFESYEEQNLDSLWSFEEVINLEIVLLLIVLTLAQLPNLTIFYITTEKASKYLPIFWKDFSFLVFLISGIITPTIDGYTQLSFAFSGITLYLTLLNMIEKRISLKFFGSLTLNF